MLNDVQKNLKENAKRKTVDDSMIIQLIRMTGKNVEGKNWGKLCLMLVAWMVENKKRDGENVARYFSRKYIEFTKIMYFGNSTHQPLAL